jgi:hypothetical protein
MQKAVLFLLPLLAGGTFQRKASAALVGLGATTLSQGSVQMVGETLAGAAGLSGPVTRAVTWALGKGVGALASFLFSAYIPGLVD